MHNLAVTFEYGDLRAELIMDCITAGIQDQKSSTKLMINEELILDECIVIVRREEAHKQQVVMRGKMETTVNYVSTTKAKAKQ